MEERLKMLQAAAQAQDSQQVKQIAAEQEKLLQENLKLKQQNEELAAKIGQEKVVVKEP
jgi:regulator of replication initiation timing